MRCDSKSAIVGLLLLLCTACNRDSRGGPEGTIAAVDTLGSARGLALYKPVKANLGPDGALYVLDQGNAELYRLGSDGGVDTIAKRGSGPGELDSPSAFSWLGDSLLVVLDAGNNRMQIFDRNGEPLRTFPYERGATSAAFDPSKGRMYAVTYGRGFAMIDGQPHVQPDSLATLISLADGQPLGKFGSPRPYEGQIIPIAGNYVHLARNPVSGELWIAWPLEPVVARYDATGRYLGTFERPLSFTPPEPSEYQSPTSPFPRGDFQQLTYDVAVDSTNHLYVLTPIAAKEGLLSSEDYEPPPQAVDVIDSTGVLRCRIKLPFTASSLTIAGSNTLLLTDALELGEVYRVRFRCPQQRLPASADLVSSTGNE